VTRTREVFAGHPWSEEKSGPVLATEDAAIRARQPYRGESVRGGQICSDCGSFAMPCECCAECSRAPGKCACALLHAETVKRELRESIEQAAWLEAQIAMEAV
jgi:hypothetical protein